MLNNSIKISKTELEKMNRRIAKLEAENKALKDILKKAYKGFSDDNPDLAFELLDDNRDLISEDK
jgi:uncharacterized protein (UPF0335 family)